MNPAAVARHLLQQDIGLSVSLRLLHRTALGAGGSMPVAAEALGRELRREPDSFRLLQPWRNLLARPRNPAPERSRNRFPASEDAVVVLTDTPGLPSTSPGISTSVRVCVLWLGAQVDAASPRAVARWARLAHSCALTEQRSQAPCRSATAATHPSSVT